MRIVLVTGRLAEEAVRKYAQHVGVDADVVVLNYPVAAFLNSETIISGLKNYDLSGTDMILTPGLSLGDTKVISDTFNVPTFKGPRYAADLPIVLKALGDVELSTVTPACDLLRDVLTENALREIENVEQNREELLKRQGNMLIKNLAIGKDFPMRVIAEIVDATLMTNDEIQNLAKKFVAQGAHIIDAGMIAGKNDPENAKRIIKAIKAAVNVPVSIDTLNPEEIQAAVSVGADMILSADAGNIDDLAKFATDIPVVIIPTNQQTGYFPKKACERVQLLEELIAKAKNLGFKKVLADLILEPTNVLESFIAFKDFGAKHPDIPLFVGAANVTELFDADSIGINALLSKLSSEIDTSIILATEKSVKAKGTVKETAVAAKMMYLAKKRASVPKDLGINMLILKDKRSREEPYNAALEQQATNITFATDDKIEQLERDSVGMFKIAVDRKNNNIIASLFTDTSMNKPANIIKGKTARAIYIKIIQLKLVT
ncbi:MAG: dihydropteroate synthase-like protein, partial [Nitrososphaerota archaeon]|nr:dihydropteroate synthase-like protein [Nitrososphaerota archaeon]